MKRWSKQRSILSRTAQLRERRRKAKDVSSVESSKFVLMEIVTAKRRAAPPNEWRTTSNETRAGMQYRPQASGLNVQYRPDAHTRKTKGRRSLAKALEGGTGRRPSRKPRMTCEVPPWRRVSMVAAQCHTLHRPSRKTNNPPSECKDEARHGLCSARHSVRCLEDCWRRCSRT